MNTRLFFACRWIYKNEIAKSEVLRDSLAQFKK